MNWDTAVSDLEWHYVDVRGADELFHYGKVVDTAEDGLWINFGCGDTSQLVPFGNIYHPGWKSVIHALVCIWETTSAISTDANREYHVQVLLRMNPTEPAKWYPAILLYYHTAHLENGHFTTGGAYGFVRITLPDGERSLVVSSKHIRYRPREPELRHSLLEDGCFNKEELDLPQRYSGDQGKLLINAFNSRYTEFGMTAAGINDKKLTVLNVTDKFRRKFDRRYRIGPVMLNEATLARLLDKATTGKLAQRHGQEGFEQDQTSASRANTVPQCGSNPTFSTFADHLL